MARPDPFVDEVIGNRYRLVACIGLGGFGAICKAKHVRSCAPAKSASKRDEARARARRKRAESRTQGRTALSPGSRHLDRGYEHRATQARPPAPVG